MPRKLALKITCGAEASERANQGFTVAAAAVAAGAEVSLWLTGEAVWFGTSDRAPDLALAQAAPVTDLLAVVLAGGMVTVCTQCAARRGLVQADLLDGIRIAGAAVFTEEILFPEAQALVY